MVVCVGVVAGHRREQVGGSLLEFLYVNAGFFRRGDCPCSAKGAIAF